VSRAAAGEALAPADVETPEPGPGQLRIAVKAAGVNFPDTLIIRDLYQFKPPRPFAPGGEVSGVIEAISDGVKGFAVGDRVLSGGIHGGFATHFIAEAARTHKIPEDMPFDEAAAFIFTYGTSHHALKQRAALGAGDTLLVLGAAGGVGLAAVELGAAMGARVIAAASSEEKVALARERGAEGGVVYGRGPFDKDGAKALAAQFKEACAPHGADVVYDAVGGDYAEAALRAIAWEGRFLVVGFPAGIPRIPLNLALLKGCQIVGVFWGAFTQREPKAHEENTQELLEYVSQGRLKPHISGTFALEEAGEAIRGAGARRD